MTMDYLKYQAGSSTATQGQYLAVVDGEFALVDQIHVGEETASTHPELIRDDRNYISRLRLVTLTDS